VVTRDPLLARHFVGCFFGTREALAVSFAWLRHPDLQSEEGRPAGSPSAMQLLNNKHGNTNAGMQDVKQEILAIHFVNVAVVIERPFRWPGINQLE
jgi:hypothetical protein